MNKTTPAFKKCGPCGFKWDTLDAFLGDPNIEIVGYQVHFEELTLGVFLFNHSCKATLAIKVDEFKHLYNGPVFEQRMTGEEQCPGYCLREDELGPCPAHCECAYIREIIQRIQRFGRSKDLRYITCNCISF
ncbi:MAG: hypothetical protein DRH90_20500 [Deltaproteobacteria bacterium]|nr:MAG: hypothetical protein DRH90_20500 [Deltaproteobacteria bacterium]RLC14849.1 MAG: hypothetical protein DRI24_12445 [Deltaproteobacteria bacterium]HHE74204.1 hypothetical protein [Desulfobacteraceae bacterium]